MKRVLSIQDLSCLGKCSLTVALPILSAMGISASALPTAVLSTHTGFPGPEVVPMTDSLLSFASHWEHIGAEFDAVSTGYLSGPEQAEALCRVLDGLSCQKVVDPAMGDSGRLYSRITPAHVEAMQELCRRGDYLLPNLTEAAFLTGLPYRESPDIPYLAELAEGLCAFGAKGVIITGIRWDSLRTGWAGMENGRFVSYQAKRIPRSHHGTGDMFTAVATGCLALGKSLHISGALAAKFVEQVMAATPESSPFGANFESCLPWLWEQL